MEVRGQDLLGFVYRRPPLMVNHDHLCAGGLEAVSESVGSEAAEKRDVDKSGPPSSKCAYPALNLP
jgi:hypothetical protein